MRKLLILILSLSCSYTGYAYQLKASLDPFITLPSVYSLTPDKMEELFRYQGVEQSPYYQWLNKEKSRAIFKRHPYENLSVDLTILNTTIPVYELVVDFQGGKFLGCSFSIFNRGDSRGKKLSLEEFNEHTQAIKEHLTKALAIRGQKRKPNIRKGILTSGYIWSSSRGVATLEYNETAESGKVDFISIRLAKRGAKGIYSAASIERSLATVRKSELKKLVKRIGSEVVIEGLPMVDQGTKGYCVVASVQRLFELYGIPCDMHQLAELAKSNPRGGTNALIANQQLSKIDYRFKTRFTCLAIRDRNTLVELKDGKYVGSQVTSRTFEREIFRSLDKGIPLLWCLELGKFKEVPPLHNQTLGGHMRVITGYDKSKNKLFFSDSWGIGHEKKYMDLDDAYNCTTGLYSLVPILN